MQLPEELQFIINARLKQNSTTARLDGKVCVVTGATSGVGYYAALRLAQGGARLILICRDAAKGARVKQRIEARGAGCELIVADFSHLPDVRRAARALLEPHSRIDVLINNAGVHNARRILTNAGIEQVFCVNHLASFLLTRLLLDRLIESAPARIIQVSSQGHRFGGLDLNDLNWERRRYFGLRSYGASKTAQLLTVWELAGALRTTGVTINGVHPGNVRTNIGMNNSLLYQWYQRLLIWPFLNRPAISGETIYYFAAAPEMGGVSGRYFNQTIEETPAAHALDRELGARVLEISERITGLPPLNGSG